MKKKLLILLSLLFFTPFVINAEELKMDWQKSWGGNKADSFSDIIHTTDGCFVAVGSYSSTDIDGLPNKGEQDAIIVKYDKDGNMLWQKSLGGNKADSFSDILQTTDGGFVSVGYTYSTDIEGLPNKGIYGSNDAIIVKYDKDGNMLWQKSWGGNRDDDFYDIIYTTAGGFVAVGFSNSTDIEGLLNKGTWDAIIVKYDKDGNMLWQKSWGGNNSDSFENILQTIDGGLVAVGDTYSTDIDGLPNKGERDAIIVKYDKDGNMLWQKSLGGNKADSFKKILQTIDGDLVAYGSSNSTDIDGLPNKGSYDAIIVKYNKDGNMLWQKSWGGNRGDFFSDIIHTTDEGLVAVGSSNSTDIEGFPNDSYFDDAIIVKYDKDGNMLWQKSWGGNRDDSFENILQTIDGDLVAVGSYSSTDIDGLPNKGEPDAIIVKYDKDGNMLWQKSWGGNNNDYFENILQTIDGGLVAVSHSYSTDIEGLPNKGDKDVIIVKYSINYDIKTSESENGTYTVTQQGLKGIITVNPNEKYEVDQIVIKDKEGNVLDLEVTKLEDGTYSFELYDDVSVEVLFKEVLVNPKTGLIDVLLVLFIGLAISISGFFIVKRYNERLEF